MARMKRPEDTLMNKLLIATTLALGLATGFAVAQTDKAPSSQQRAERFERMLDRRVERMTEELNLTPAQALQVRAIFEEQAQARRELMQRHREEMMTLHEQGKARLDGVLNPEQKAKLETLKAERGQAWKDGRAHRRGHHHGMRRGAGKVK